MTTDMTGEFEKQTGVSVKDLKSNVDKEIAGLKSEMAGTTSSLQKELNSVGSSVSKTAKSVGKAASGATKPGTTSKSSTAAKSTSTAKSASTAKAGSTSKSTAAAAKKQEAAPIVVQASKSDPLAGVSFMDDVPAPTKPNGTDSSNGSEPVAVSGTQADALMRARARRQSAGYNQGPPSLN
ncbi:MAG: hypothetical protein IT335_11420 [Thermomicrobiales bacterium]|nr:hypothetical protein [Thermomicrobiales bacterium]